MSRSAGRALLRRWAHKEHQQKDERAPDGYCQCAARNCRAALTCRYRCRSSRGGPKCYVG
eukprot:4325314-Amphidinium_carterae.1